MQTRRSFTTEDKIRLLDEAARPGSSVSGVAKANQVNPSLMFSWRKQLRSGGNSLRSPQEPETVVAGLLVGIEQFEQTLAPLVVEKFMRDLRTDQISSHNASTSFACLVSSFAKLAELKLNVLEKLAAVESTLGPTTKSPEEIQKERELREFSERMLVALAKDKARSCT